MVGLNSPGEDSPFVLSPHIPDCFNLSRVFFATHGRLFASRTFTWYHYCNRNWSGCARTEARGQSDLVLTHYHCNGMGSNTLSDDFKVISLPL